MSELDKHTAKKILKMNPDLITLLQAAADKRKDDPLAGLILTKEGVPKGCLHNAVLVLRHHPDWKGVLSYNEFTSRPVTAKPAPWQSEAGRNWTDYDDTRATEWLQHNGIMVSSTNITAEAVLAVARENTFHPVRDYLNSLEWDGTARLTTWLPFYTGSKADTYTEAVGSRWLISAVARIFRPGCQVDHTLLLQGKQGIQKSSGFRALASDEWFTDHISPLGDKDSRMELLGKWIIELAELDRLKGANLERVKSFLTARIDNFRPPYGRGVTSFPRQCTFAGTSNADTPFTDETGNRRFWPVDCESVNVRALTTDRDQLWAEACVRFKAGEAWWLDTAELNHAAEKEQESRYDGDPWDDFILDWCRYPTRRVEGGDSLASEIGKVLTAEILVHALGKPAGQISKGDEMRVARCLRHHGWRRGLQVGSGAHRGKRFYVLGEHFGD